MNNSLPCMVADIGECYTKIGDGNEDVPRAIVPSQYCSTEDSFIMWGADSRVENYYGFDCTRREQFMEKKSFFGEQREFINQKDIGKFIHHLMVENFDSSETVHQAALILDKPNLPTESKKELGEVLLEWNKFTKFLIIPDYIGTLYSTGKSSGTVLSCGHGTTYVASIFNGIPSPFSIEYSSVTASRIQDSYRELLTDINYQRSKKGEIRFSQPSSLEVQNFFEANGMVRSPDTAKEAKSVKLPDGTQFTLDNSELSDPLEAYFTPQGTGNRQKPSLTELISKSVKSVTEFYGDELTSNIVMEGGVTKLPNFYERLYSELLTEKSTKPKIVNIGDRLLYPWAGAAKLKDWFEDNRMWYDRRLANENGLERSLAEIAKSF